MRVRVRLFAGTRDAVGAPSVEVDVGEGARVDDVMDALCATHPRLARYRPHALFAVDGAFVPSTTRVVGKEIAVMPPVSGGNGLPALSTAKARRMRSGREAVRNVGFARPSRVSCLRGVRRGRREP
jgi:molybdopterin converting factor small subunit